MAATVAAIRQLPTITATTGGTGFTTYTTGDIIYASASNTLSKLGIGTANFVIASEGGVPVWRNIAGSAGLASNFTTSSTTSVSTNLTFAIGASEIWDVEITGTCQKATSATGMKIAIAAPVGCTISGEIFGGQATFAAALVGQALPAINTLNTTAFATGIGIQVPFQVFIHVVNSTTAGNITLQAATVTSNVATIFAGTRMTWTRSQNL